MSHRFRDMASFPLANAHYSISSIQPLMWKCSFCIRWLEFCMPEFNAHG